MLKIKIFYKLILSMLATQTGFAMESIHQSTWVKTIEHKLFGTMEVISNERHYKKFDEYLAKNGMDPNNSENVVEMFLKNCDETPNEEKAKQLMELGGETYQGAFPFEKARNFYKEIAKNPVGRNIMKVIAANGVEISDNNYPPCYLLVSEKKTRFLCRYDLDNNPLIWGIALSKPSELHVYDIKRKNFDYVTSELKELLHETIHWYDRINDWNSYHDPIPAMRDNRYLSFMKLDVTCENNKDALSKIFHDTCELWDMCGFKFCKDNKFRYESNNEAHYWAVENGKEKILRSGYKLYPDNTYRKLCLHLEKQHNFFSFYFQDSVKNLGNY